VLVKNEMPCRVLEPRIRFSDMFSTILGGLVELGEEGRHEEAKRIVFSTKGLLKADSRLDKCLKENLINTLLMKLSFYTPAPEERKKLILRALWSSKKTGRVLEIIGCCLSFAWELNQQGKPDKAQNAVEQAIEWCNMLGFAAPPTYFRYLNILRQDVILKKMGSAPLDVLYKVFDFLDQKSLYWWHLVCRHYANLLRPRLYNKISVRRDRLGCLARTLKGNPSLGSFTQYISIRNDGKPWNRLNSNELVEIISHTSSLKKFAIPQMCQRRFWRPVFLKLHSCFHGLKLLELDMHHGGPKELQPLSLPVLRELRMTGFWCDRYDFFVIHDDEVDEGDDEDDDNDYHYHYHSHYVDKGDIPWFVLDMPQLEILRIKDGYIDAKALPYLKNFLSRLRVLEYRIFPKIDPMGTGPHCTAKDLVAALQPDKVQEVYLNFGDMPASTQQRPVS
jgi:hypothetical protein